MKITLWACEVHNAYTSESWQLLSFYLSKWGAQCLHQ